MGSKRRRGGDSERRVREERCVRVAVREVRYAHTRLLCRSGWGKDGVTKRNGRGRQGAKMGESADRERESGREGDERARG